MTALNDACRGLQEQNFETGSVLIEQGARSGRMYVLIEGEVGVVRDGIEIAVVSEAGAVFGEMSILLDNPHGATVMVRQPVRAYRIDDGDAFLRSHPDVTLQISRILAMRLHLLNGYLSDLAQQYAGHGNHLSMVGEILGSLAQHPELEFKLGSDREPGPAG
jgi:CRP-like cAMP-binding protein